MIMYAGYQLLFSKPELAERVGPAFAQVNAVGSMWLLACQYAHPVIALVLNAAMFGASLYAYIRINDVFATYPRKFSEMDYLIANAPFSMLTPWLGVNMATNFLKVGTTYGWTALSGPLPAILVVAVLGFSALAPLTIPEFIFPSVMVWSLWGIFQKQRHIATDVAGAALTAAVLIALSLGWQTVGIVKQKLGKLQLEGRIPVVDERVLSQTEEHIARPPTEAPRPEGLQTEKISG
jgi:hypothetical protein